MQYVAKFLESLFKQTVEILSEKVEFSTQLAPILLAIEHKEISDVLELVQRLQQLQLDDLASQVKTIIFQSLSELKGMGNNVLQYVTQHFSNEVTLLTPVVNVLDAAQIGDLFIQKNSKNGCLFNVVLYYSLNSLTLWLPVAARLEASYRSKIFEQRISGLNLLQFVAMVCPRNLPLFFPLMVDLIEVDVLRLVGEKDRHGMTLIHYIAFYYPDELSSLLAFSKQWLPKLLSEKNNSAKTVLIDVMAHFHSNAAMHILDSVASFKSQDKADILAQQDEKGNTVIMLALQKKCRADVGDRINQLFLGLEPKDRPSEIPLDLSDLNRCALLEQEEPASSTGFFSKTRERGMNGTDIILQGAWTPSIGNL
jgi:hypothetical protein